MSFVLGLPGQPPRLIMDVPATAASLQVLPGETLFEANVPPGRFVINATGDALEAFVVPFVDDQDTLWIAARAYRDRQAAAGCDTPFGVRVDTDPESRSKINGACTAAMVAKSAGEPFSIAWTMEDNSVMTFDADMTIALGLAVMQHVDACQVAGTAIRTNIYAASDRSALQAIDIEEGYP